MKVITQLTNHENKKRTKTKFDSIWMLVFALILIVASSACAQQSARVLLQSGLYKENVNGELEAAIAIYERILKEFPKDRPVAAKALLHIGMCYEQMGKNEARKAYNRLVQDYADQTGEVAEARTRLSALDQAESAAKPPEGVTVRQVWSDWRVGGVGTVSPSGRYLALVDWNSNFNLAVRELATGTERTLAATQSEKDDEWEGVIGESIVFSPDSTRIVYAWYNSKDEGVDLRVVSLDEPKPRVLYSAGSDKQVYPVAWSPNGNDILAEFHSNGGDGSQYGLVSVSDGSSRILESLTGDKVGHVAGFSPDGKYILYSSPQDKGSLRSDVFLFALDSGAYSRLVEHPANDKALGWAPNGSGVLFASDRRGNRDAWLIQVVDGKPQGEPQRIKADLGQINPLGFTQSGSYYYTTFSTLSDVYVATLDVEAGKVVEPQNKVSLQREGSSTYADWSPDGKYLAYISQGPGATHDLARIVILTLETGEYRELSIPLQYIGAKGARWSPDGRSFVLWGAKDNDKPSTWGIYRINAQTGQESLIRQGRYSQPDWTPDGKVIVYKVEGEKDHSSIDDILYHIVIYDLETGKEREIAVARHGNITQAFALSPDGRQLAFTALEKDTGSKSMVLNVMPVAGGKQRELTRLQLPDKIGKLEWTPDGKWVLFERQSKQKTVISRIPADGGAAQAFDLVPAGYSRSSLFPCLHSDGRRIAFTGGNTWVGDVWVMENFLPKPEPKPANDTTVRQVWKDRRAGGVGAVSHSGRRVAFTDRETGDLAIHEMATGTNRPLTTGGSLGKETSEHALTQFQVFSPDDRQIAYAWANKENAIDLQIVGIDGSGHRVLRRGESDRGTLPLAWSPDGKSLLAAFTTEKNAELGLISVSDGSHRILKSLSWDMNGRMCFSPDGKYILYDSPQEKDSPQSDIFLFHLESGNPSCLVKHPADDKVLGWTPDGSGVLFASDRQGSRDAWLIQVADGKPQGEPQLIRSDIGQMQPLGFTKDGSYYYSVSLLPTDIYVATIDLEAGKVIESPAKVSLRQEEWSGFPDWSPDGQYLAYLSQELGDARDFAKIVIQNLKTSKCRELSTSLRDVWMKGARWSPDGRSFILAGKSSDDGGLFRIDVQSGAESLISFGGGHPEWTPDGKAVVFVKRGKPGFRRIMLLDLETDRKRELVVAAGVPRWDYNFALSPDGRRLAFTALGKDGKSVTLNIVPIAGGNPRELTRVSQGERIGALEWVPDGSRVLFEKRVENQIALWSVPAEGGVPHESGLVATTWGRPYLFPRMHPDGRRIAFTGSSPSSAEVWAMENFLPAAEASAEGE